MVLPSVCYQNWQIQVFVENLLYATVVDTLPAESTRLRYAVPPNINIINVVVVIIVIASFVFASYVVGRHVVECIAGYRRAGFSVEEGWKYIVGQKHE